MGRRREADGRRRSARRSPRACGLSRGRAAARRELAVYREGLASAEPGRALRAPRLLGWDEGPDHVELWLESLVDVHGGSWPVSRYGQAPPHTRPWGAPA